MPYEARGNRAEILKLLMRRSVVECREVHSTPMLSMSVITFANVNEVNLVSLYYQVFVTAAAAIECISECEMRCLFLLHGLLYYHRRTVRIHILLTLHPRNLIIS